MRTPIVIAAVALALLPVAPAEARGRPMGHVFDWSHELNLEEHPRWKPKGPLPMPVRRWYSVVDGVLTTAGRNGLWFSGFGALPFDIPVAPREPKAWRNSSNFMRLYRSTGLSWDAQMEAYAAKDALCIFPRRPKTCRPTGTVFQPDTDAPTRRMSLLDPAYRRSALSEIRRIVPGLAGKPYVWSYTGSDEPIVVLPRGRKALASRVWRGQAARIRREFGWAPPKAGAKPSHSVTAGLRWLAYSRWTSREFFGMKAEQSALIHRLDPSARVAPNDYGFIDGFMPWDYTALGGFADIVEADPYVSYAERSNPGRGRYNPGFGAKLLSDLTGKRTRIIVQSFPYSGYTPRPADLDAWAGQALRAGATDISLFGLGNPRFTNRRLYDGMLSLASRLRTATLPDPPTDPSTLVVYSVMSEGQAQPWRAGDNRYRTSGDAIYTTYATLGELAHGAFSFDSDTRLEASPSRLARAHAMWLPRGDTLTRPFADAVLAWVRAGGFLVVTDPEAFTRTPENADLSDVRAALMGGRRTTARGGGVLLVPKGTLAPGLPVDLLGVPVDDSRSWAFQDVPADGTVVATHLDDRPAAVLRSVGQGRVLSFAADPMSPSSLVEPMDLVTLVAAIQRVAGGELGNPAWAWRVPGGADRPPWVGSYDP